MIFVYLCLCLCLCLLELTQNRGECVNFCSRSYDVGIYDRVMRVATISHVNCVLFVVRLF